MDGSNKVVESLDSLWFFNNVLTLPTFELKDLGVALREDTVQEEEEEEEEEPSKPKIQGAPSTEVLVPRCPNCGEMAVGIEQQPIKGIEFAKPTEKPERRRRRRRRKRSKRKVLGELDLGFHGYKLASESSFSEESIGHSNFENPSFTKMPSLNDRLAMKEHLKSWAHAVACTVR